MIAISNKLKNGSKMGHRIIKSGIPVFFTFLILATMIIISGGCYYDNEEDLYPNTAECDTLNITYETAIAPIMANSCNSCHSGTAPSGGIKTDSYNDLSVIANSGRLWGAVSHAQGYSPMPKDQAKLSDCALTKIEKWINSGLPEN